MNQARRNVCLSGAIVLSVFLASGSLAARQARTPEGQRPERNAAHGSVPYNDEQFVRSAAEASMSQVDIGKIAEQRSQSPEVKKFAQMMVEEHSKLTEQLKQMGMSESINLPTSVSRDDANAHRSLNTMNGTNFDRAYLERVSSELHRQLGEFERGASLGTKPALKEYAQRTQPTLQSELQQTKQLLSRVGR
jgi:putative membrane protein